MCFLFLSIGYNTETNAALLEKYLYEGTITKNYRDGYGFAWKNATTAVEEWHTHQSHKHFFHLPTTRAAHAASAHAALHNTIIGHIRQDRPDVTGIIAPAASKNTHPFFYKNNVFVHNGAIENFQRHRAKILSVISPELARQIRGNTDSEYIFYLLLTFMSAAAAKDKKSAIQECFTWLKENKINGFYNIIIGTNDGAIVVIRYSIGGKTPLPLYVFYRGAKTLVSSSRLQTQQKMMKANIITIL
jgi:predicted glutamine amidotransferase